LDIVGDRDHNNWDSKIFKRMHQSAAGSALTVNNLEHA